MSSLSPQISPAYHISRNHPGKCHFLVSSRPVGYPPGALGKLEFVECDLLDFEDDQVREYTRHWCTAVRLARNEPEAEARREGSTDGDSIVDGFSKHSYIRNLARNPLMLSAICLVNYFGSGKLPEGRAELYQLCVEGLLHYWDQRRGIHSAFTLEEKLRACREVALAMQAADRAEYEADEVEKLFAAVLDDPARAKQLLEHVRYRTGLLLERRPNVFAFAHLTFQEYLAARGIHEGNRLGIDAEQLVREHDDGRWHEVIALYCGLAPAPAARAAVERLVAQSDTRSLGDVLAEAYLSAGADMLRDAELRQRVLKRIAPLPISGRLALERFPDQEVAPVANACVGTSKNDSTDLSEAYRWLYEHSESVDAARLAERLRGWKDMSPLQVTELACILHKQAPDKLLIEISTDTQMYASPGPRLPGGDAYASMAEVALIGLADRKVSQLGSPGFDAVLCQTLNGLLRTGEISAGETIHTFLRFIRSSTHSTLATTRSTELAQLARQLAKRVRHSSETGPIAPLLNGWADRLEAAVAEA